MKDKNSAHLSALCLQQDLSEQKLYTILLQDEGFHEVAACTDSTEALRLLQEKKILLILIDINFILDAHQFFIPKVLLDYPGVQVIIITPQAQIHQAFECVKQGAFQFLIKPITMQQLIAAVRQAMELSSLKDEITCLKDHVLSNPSWDPIVFAPIVTQNDKMHAIFSYLQAVAAGSAPILITGESGTGKELFAHAAHTLSGRRKKLIPVNIAGLDDYQFSDTLFGHVKGAYTGAHSNRKGLLEQAQNGTIFLDEIGDLHLESQIKLLRLVQESEYRKIGDDQLVKAEARIILATNKNLEAAVENRIFRRDLYYRLLIHHIHLPPLRERIDDLPLLARAFIQKHGKNPNIEIPEQTLELFKHYAFPGNVREFEHMIVDSLKTTKDTILNMDYYITKFRLSEAVQKPTTSDAARDLHHCFDEQRILEKPPSVKAVTEYLIDLILKQQSGNQSKTAKILGISQSAISRRLQQRKSKKKSP